MWWTTLLALFVSLVSTFAFLRWKKAFGKKGWTIAIVPALLFSVCLAYVSVSTVWVPHPLSDDVFRAQNALGEFEGTFPWAKLTYPFYLTVYHTPFVALSIQQPYAYGRVRFTVVFAGENIGRINGTFWYPYVMGPMPLFYEIDFLFSDSLQFFRFLLFLYTIFNFVGAPLGVGLAYTLNRKVYLAKFVATQDIGALFHR